MKKTKKKKELNAEQLDALKILQSECNVFLTEQPERARASSSKNSESKAPPMP
jgi:hypothetical protein